MSGDCEISAKILVPSLSDRWGRAGIMIRDSLSEGSKFAAFFATSGEGSSFQFRNNNNQKSIASESNSDYVPIWLKLERKGNTFRGFKSTDGVNWTMSNRPEIIMNEEVFVGLTVSNHSIHNINEPAFITDVNISDSALTNIKAENNKPNSFLLEQNYPNPFNPSTNIKYHIYETSQVTLDIFNSLGQKVNSLVNKIQPSGTYNLTWNAKDKYGKNLSTGIFFYVLKVENNTNQWKDFKKMIYLK
jgi:hypothetical protein